MKILFDTYAWIEYFKGTEKGKKVEAYLEEEALTPSIALLELSCKAAREGWNFGKVLDFIKTNSLVIGFNEDIILNCGKIWVEARKKAPDFSLPDAVILATAINNSAKILTGDRHFKNIPDVLML